ESWLGPPIKDSLREVYDCVDARSEMADQKYRVRFATKGMYENTLVEEFTSLLAELMENDFCIHIATCKPERYAERILPHFGIAEYFDFIGGAAMDDSRPTKGHVIERVLEMSPFIDRSKTLMVGDRKYDIIGGQTYGMDTAGMLHGFGDEAELRQAGATYLFENLIELEKFLLR